MTDINPPLLETKQIVKATVFALVLGSVLFVTAVLPAEYGIDPLGTGKSLGFSRLYLPDSPVGIATIETDGPKSYPPLKLEELGSGPDVPIPREVDNPAPAKQFELRQDSVTIRVPAGKGLEYKINVLKYGQVKYEWVTNKGVLYFDFHGEPKQANPGKDEFFESYTSAYSGNMIGTFLAPFEGRHGWYFKNKTDKEVVVSLRIRGEYKLDSKE
ncbi:hypothetical protein [Dyadobacter psychrotolerans]|uniref:Transmembrane anchor protein n=1 Tax=Dyadobacter psychrotolerans TaxID=2541721 RepID=A0A4V2Z401_9BACT|nr:hypothetical protein [Dyadobacter psychrotolerans]TDE14718.1 hypothetical protein E0F88_16155 [Dyadobacter psychrotolerans]